MAEYDSARALASRLIRKKGRAGVSLVRVAPGEATNPARPWKLDEGSAFEPDVYEFDFTVGEYVESESDPDFGAKDVTIASALHAVFLSPVEARSFEGQFAFPVFSRGRADLEDSVLSETTHMVYIADSELPPGLDLTEDAVGLLLESRGVRYVVLRCQTFRPGEQAVLHIFSVKG